MLNYCLRLPDNLGQTKLRVKSHMRQGNQVHSDLVEGGNVVNWYEVADNSEMIQIDVPQERSAVNNSLANCEITSSENEFWGQQAQREVCCGIANIG